MKRALSGAIKFSLAFILLGGITFSIEKFEIKPLNSISNWVEDVIELFKKLFDGKDDETEDTDSEPTEVPTTKTETRVFVASDKSVVTYTIPEMK